MAQKATWWELPPGSHFGPDNLPVGRYSLGRGEPARIGVRIGDHVLDAFALVHHTILRTTSLLPFLADGPLMWRLLRERVHDQLTDERHRAAVERAAVPLRRVRLLRPFDVADYVDFYASEHHATNVGTILRPGQPPLSPNWKHLPIGYHGRAGTVVASGTDVLRPCGQRRGADGPEFGPSGKLDFEAEVGFVVGVGSEHGTPVPLERLADHVFGVVLVNDWSARDIQAWETVPLGPFLGKSFATSISPWVVPLAALGQAWVEPPPRDVPVLPYLDGGRGLAIELEVRLNGSVVSRPRFASMYWTPAQLLAHLTVNGASLRPGDLYASGTVSGPERGQRGCLLELTWDGTEPITLADGSVRTYLEDGDEVTITATAPGPGDAQIGFGEVTGRVGAARAGR